MTNTTYNMAKLRWACRRGMLELDLILQSFLQNHFTNLSPRDQALFVHLLECSDQDLYNWFLKAKEPHNADFKHIIEVILHGGKKLF